VNQDIGRATRPNVLPSTQTAIDESKTAKTRFRNPLAWRPISSLRSLIAVVAGVALVLWLWVAYLDPARRWQRAIRDESDGRVRCTAIRLVELGRYEEALPVLIEALRVPAGISRVKVLYVLSLVPPEFASDAVPTLLALLKAAQAVDADTGTRQSQVRAAEYLLRLGEVEPALMALTNAAKGDADILTRESARSALERIAWEPSLGSNRPLPGQSAHRQLHPPPQ
jgi:hypothetical protein